MDGEVGWGTDVRRSLREMRMFGRGRARLYVVRDKATAQSAECADYHGKNIPLLTTSTHYLASLRETNDKSRAWERA